MSIQISLEGDSLTINVLDVLDGLSIEQKNQLIEQLSCREDVIKHVSDQLVHGCTEDGYSGFTGSAASCSTAMDKAVRDIAMFSGEIAAKQIAQLERELAANIKSRNEYMNKYFDLKNKGTINDY